MKKILTIAIPSYNVQEYLVNILEKFVHSGVFQYLEILVINDGSTDKTLQIGKSFEKEYPEVIRVIDKPNGGHGSAINAGIKNANGTFFKLVDADDWLDEKGLVQIIDHLKGFTNVDMITCPLIEFNDKSRRKKTITHIGQRKKFSNQIVKAETLFYNIPPMHSIIYRTNILKEHFEKIKIDEHHFYVDVEYIVFPFLFVTKAIYIPVPLYVYRVNVAGQSTSVNSFIKNKNQHYEVLSHVNNYVRANIPKTSKKYPITVSRISQMIAAQYKIILLQKISFKTYRELKLFRSNVEEKFLFSKRDINLPIKILLGSDLLLFPLIHWLAILKARLVRQ